MNIHRTASLAETVSAILAMDADSLRQLRGNFQLREQYVSQAQRLVAEAQTSERALAEMHAALAAYYAYQFSCPPASNEDRYYGGVVADIVSVLEEAMFAFEEARIDPATLASQPKDGAGYVAWLKQTINKHPVFGHEFFEVFLRDEATIDDLKYFMAQETSLDPRFDDCLALIQMGTSGQTKLEIANNYWDEMGNGEPNEVHTTLFSHVMACLGITDEYVASAISPISTASANLAAGVCMERHRFHKAIGYFGVSEYLAPHRFKRIVAVWNRLGLPASGILYHDLHIGVDAGHANGWFNNVIVPLVDENPAAANEITRGALYRLNSSKRYLDNALEHLRADRRDAA